MFLRVVIGAFLAALVLMAWGFVFWMFLPFGKAVLQRLPGEEAVLKTLRENIPATGIYIYPSMEEAGGSKEAQETMMQKQVAGPLVEIIYRKDGLDPLSPSTYGLGLAHFFVSGLLAGGLLALALPNLKTYAARLLFVFLVGLFAAFFVDLSAGIWMNHPWDLPLLSAAYHTSSWLLAGLPMAAIIKPASH
jgi:hypothetical protein